MLFFFIVISLHISGFRILLDKQWRIKVTYTTYTKIAMSELQRVP